MTCSNCQTPILDDSRFCSQCGTPTHGSDDSATRTILLGSVGGLASGAMLAGRYKILRVLGHGGMGVVYKAEDTQLGRPVALKVLAERIAQSSADGQRFLREARASAALDHPNICTVHEVGEQDGRAYLAMAFVDGQTLREKIAERPLKLGEALAVAMQAGEGLRAAHERGVIHRDIKPGNLMVTPEGQVKLLDFGLAKLSGETQLTAEGTVLGTPAYMSPEQAKGDPVDRRTDIWSLGVVLYEMLSGRTPFAGDKSSTVLRAIIDDQPEPVTALRSGLPVGLDRIFSKALAKDPRERYQHVEDLLVDLRAIERESTGATAPQRTRSALRARRNKRRLGWGAGAAALLLLAGGSLAYRQWNSGAGAGSVMRFMSPLPDGYAFQNFSSTAPQVTISADGGKIVFAASKDGKSQLFRRNIGEFTAEPIRGTEGGEGPFLSHDGRWVGFAVGKQVKRVPFAGGRAEGQSLPVISLDFPFYGADFDSAGDPIVGQCSRGLRRVQLTLGRSSAITDVRDKDAPGYHIAPQVLGAGSLLLFTRVGPDARDIWLMNLRSGEKSRILEDGFGARYLAPGYLVYVRENDIWAVGFDLASRGVKGAPVKVLSGVLTDSAGGTHFAVSENGTLVYIPGQKYTTAWRPSWVDLAGQVTPFPKPDVEFLATGLRLSPDGGKALETRGWLNDEMQVGVHELGRNIYRTLTHGPGAAYWGVWTPDGKSMAYTSEADRNWVFNLFLAPADGSGQAERLTKSSRQQMPYSFSPDGKLLAFQQGGLEEDGYEIWILDLRTRKAEPFVTGGRGNLHPAFSPDGRWLAHATKDSGRWEVVVRPYPGPGVVTQVSTEGGWEPIWTPDGKRILYRPQNGEKILTAAFQAGAPPKVQAPRVLVEGPFVGATPFGRFYDMAPDGKRLFVIVQPDRIPPVGQYVVILNWVEELKKLVPRT